jgi:hypothetical protein
MAAQSATKSAAGDRRDLNKTQARLEKQVARAEAEIAEQEMKIKERDQMLADPTLYQEFSKWNGLHQEQDTWEKARTPHRPVGISVIGIGRGEAKTGGDQLPRQDAQGLPRRLNRFFEIAIQPLIFSLAVTTSSQTTPIRKPFSKALPRRPSHPAFPVAQHGPGQGTPVTQSLVGVNKLFLGVQTGAHLIDVVQNRCDGLRASLRRNQGRAHGG